MRILSEPQLLNLLLRLLPLLLHPMRLRPLLLPHCCRRAILALIPPLPHQILVGMCGIP